MSKQASVLSTLLLITCAVAPAAEPKWIRVPSSDFEIFSTANESSTMQVLRHFEEVRSFFNQTTTGQPAVQSEPVRIIVFSSEKEYLPYRPSEAAAAFYTQVAGRDYIVLGNVSDEVFPIAVHEYVHLVAEHAGMHLPPWANEGIADVYSTLKPEGKQVLIGNLIQGHLYEIAQNSWVPLATILATDRNSPYYNEKKKAGAFYAESWAFMHLLMLEPQYRSHYEKLLAELQAGTPSQQAVESIYGKPLSAFDKEVPSYILGGHLSAGLLPAKLNDGADIHSQPAQPFDVKLALLDLLERPGKEAERRKGLTDLAAEFPQRPEPHSALAYLDWRSSQTPEAIREFRAAVDLGGRNPKMLWDYGRMAASSNAADAMQALSMLLTVDPNRVDVRLTLAQIQENNRQYSEALTTLGAVKKVGAEDAPKLFRMIAYASINTKDLEEAKVAAHRWQDTAKTDDDKASAARMVQYLDAASAPKQASATMARNADPGPVSAPAPPAARDTNVPPPVPAARATRPSVAGAFVEFNCSKKQPRFVLKTAEGPASFLMDDPEKIFIRGRDSNTIDLHCGAQKQSSLIWIEYDPPPASENDVRGVARVIHFEAPGTDSGK